MIKACIAKKGALTPLFDCISSRPPLRQSTFTVSDVNNENVTEVFDDHHSLVMQFADKILVHAFTTSPQPTLPVDPLLDSSRPSQVVDLVELEPHLRRFSPVLDQAMQAEPGNRFLFFDFFSNFSTVADCFWAAKFINYLGFTKKNEILGSGSVKVANTLLNGRAGTQCLNTQGFVTSKGERSYENFVAYLDQHMGKKGVLEVDGVWAGCSV